MSRILLVTIALRGRSGTEVVSYETAHGLRDRGHDVYLFTHITGPLAEKLRADGFPIFTDLAALSSIPDVIQSNQSDQLLDAVAKFPEVPVISICHDASTWWSEPVHLPSIRRHVAVDLACHARIVSRNPELAKSVELLHNAVDLDRFLSRSPLPERPKRAIILAKQGSNYLDSVRAACLRRGIDVDAVGATIGNEIGNLSTRLPEYDLVFATARSALEAMAIGCAVIVVDGRGLSGLVTRDVVSSWRDKNFGAWLLSRPISEDAIGGEIDRYDPSDARKVSDYIRKHSSLDHYLDRLEEIYRDVISQGPVVPVGNDAWLSRMNQAFRLLATLERAAREAETNRERAAREAEVSLERTAREAEFQAAFQAYRESMKLGRRIRRKIRSLLTRDVQYK
jgi:hypothetical protein